MEALGAGCTGRVVLHLSLGSGKAAATVSCTRPPAQILRRTGVCWHALISVHMHSPEEALQVHKAQQLGVLQGVSGLRVSILGHLPTVQQPERRAMQAAQQLGALRWTERLHFGSTPFAQSRGILGPCSSQKGRRL